MSIVALASNGSAAFHIAGFLFANTLEYAAGIAGF
jgi:hypothetical protein